MYHFCALVGIYTLLVRFLGTLKILCVSAGRLIPKVDVLRGSRVPVVTVFISDLWVFTD